MRRLVFALLLLILPTTVFAQYGGGDRYRRYYSPQNKFELTPFVGYRWGGTIYSDTTDLFGEDVDVASNGNYGVNFGIPMGNTPLKLELMVNRQDSHLETAGGGLFTPNDRVANMHITYYHAGLQVPFSESRNAVPYAIISAGVSNLKPDIVGVSADNRFSASAGVGVKIPINPNFGIRLEGRGYFTSLDNGNGDRCGNYPYRCYDNYYGHDLYQGEANLGFVISF